MRVGTLNEKQQQVYNAVVHEHRNVLITGAGGGGKSHTIGEIVKTLNEMNTPYAVTASTGAAGDEPFPWGTVAVGVAALGVVGGGAYYLKTRSEEQAAMPAASETDRIAEAYLQQLRAAGSY